MITHSHPTAPAAGRATSSADADRRPVEPDDLMCPACTRSVQPGPVGGGQPENGLPAGSEWSHVDGSPLCWQLSGELATPVARGGRVRAGGGAR
jgi:hypothetical protein